jgi:type IV secretory pathway component VirB8
MSKLDILRKRLEKLLKEYKKLQNEYKRTREWDLDKLQDLNDRRDALLEAIERAKSPS